MGSPSPGVWLSTHPDRLPAARTILAEAGVLADAQMFLATHAGGGELIELVRQAWDLDEVETAYESFLDEFSAESGRTIR